MKRGTETQRVKSDLILLPAKFTARMQHKSILVIPAVY